MNLRTYPEQKFIRAHRNKLPRNKSATIGQKELNSYIQKLQTGITQRHLWAITHLLFLNPWRFMGTFILVILQLSVIDCIDFTIYLSHGQWLIPPPFSFMGMFINNDALDVASRILTSTLLSLFRLGININVILVHIVIDSFRWIAIMLYGLRSVALKDSLEAT